MRLCSGGALNVSQNPGRMVRFKMDTIELFSGTKSFSKVASKLGHSILTIDNDPGLSPDISMDLSISLDELWLSQKRLRENYDILWASPPCTAFSVASIGRHWTKDKDKYIPKSSGAMMGLKLLNNTINIIAVMKPRYWYIENPRGMMRKIIDEIFERHGITDYVHKTISYCQYGDNRMKPTDIWTNDKSWIPRPICKNGDKCHISAPRGSRTGTQGLKNAKDRGVIPEAVFFEIFNNK